MSELAFLEEYLRHFDRSFTNETASDLVRFVVLDSETTGLDPRKDRLITIGAVAVIGGEIPVRRVGWEIPHTAARFARD